MKTAELYFDAMYETLPFMDKMIIGSNRDKILAIMESYADQWRRWIPVTERMPEPMTEVMVILDNGHYQVDMLIDSEHDNTGEGGGWNWFDNVTHWLPIPKLEEEK